MDNVQDIQKILPHRFPILLVDKILELNLKKKIIAQKNITFNDPIFQGHFPGHPIYPAVHLVEGLCQCAQLMYQSELAVTVKLEDFKFSKPVVPGDILIYEVILDSEKGPFVVSKAEIKVAGKIVTKGIITGQCLSK